MSELSDYLALVEQRKAQQENVSLPMPSGAVWRLRPINTMQYTVSGRVPTYILQKNGNGSAPQEVSEKEQIEIGMQMMELARDVMLNNLVFPKITMEPEPDSIWIKEVAEKIDPEDFTFFAQWLMKGGQVTQNSFRKPAKRRRK